MIDHLLAFFDEPTAKTDPVVGVYYVNGAWRGDVCLPGVLVWAPAQDVTSTTTDPVTGQQVTTVTHTPYDGLWRIVIALPQKAPALAGSVACELVADRDAANAGRPFIVQAQLTDDQLSALMIAPTFAGSSYPFGAPR